MIGIVNSICLWGNLKMTNNKEHYGNDRKNKYVIQQEKSFSLFTCTKKTFKDWFDPI